MSKEKNKSEESFFVGIRDSSELRKDILTTSKQVIVSLKRYENFKLLRSEKVKLMFELRKTLKELDFLNQKLRKALPKTNIRAAYEKTQKNVSVESVRQVSRKKKQFSELEKLEQQLLSVESKIKRLE